MIERKSAMWKIGLPLVLSRLRAKSDSRPYTSFSGVFWEDKWCGSRKRQIFLGSDRCHFVTRICSFILFSFWRHLQYISWVCKLCWNLKWMEFHMALRWVISMEIFFYTHKKRSTRSYARNAFVDHVCPRRQANNIFSVSCKGGNTAVCTVSLHSAMKPSAKSHWLVPPGPAFGFGHSCNLLSSTAELLLTLGSHTCILYMYRFYICTDKHLGIPWHRVDSQLYHRVECYKSGAGFWVLNPGSHAQN